LDVRRAKLKNSPFAEFAPEGAPANPPLTAGEAFELAAYATVPPIFILISFVVLRWTLRWIVRGFLR
jgi:hypothetical protein